MWPPSAPDFLLLEDRGPIVRAEPRCGWSPRGRQLRKDARGVDALVLIKVVVQVLLFHLKAVCSLSTPCLITIAKHEKANSQ